MSWNTLVETIEEKSSPKQALLNDAYIAPIQLKDVPPKASLIFPTQLSEVDRVLGGGVVQGSAILIGGEPGIGKSTLTLQMAHIFASTSKTVLYVSGEESLDQLSLRSQRLSTHNDTVFVMHEQNLNAIIAAIKTIKPSLVIIDSIQVIQTPSISSVAGSVTQVRECAQELISLIKSMDTTLVVVGHITKDGSLAGPKVLEHIVDVILAMEGQKDKSYRLLRCLKNRYGSTQELGLLDMTQEGLKSIQDATALFIDEGALNRPGSVITPVCEGSRVLLVEIQALVVESGYGIAKRTFLGVDPNRANVMIAAMDKLLNLKLMSKDIFISIIGGLKLSEPSIDLAMVTAILSSLTDTPVGAKVAVFGEVGLTGEIRATPNAEKRISELDKIGFKTVFYPEKNPLKYQSKSLTTIPVSDIQTIPLNR
jgi:DNA repair protein RadA/Sms